MSVNRTARCVLARLFCCAGVIFFTTPAHSASSGQQIREDAAARSSHADAAQVRFYSNGLMDGVFGFKRRGLPEQERNLDPTGTSPLSSAREPSELQPNEPLISGIQRGTPAKRAAALRLAEKGRQHLLRKQYQEAVAYLEKALGLEASPYIYYYLAGAHYHLGHHVESANFLEVAATSLAFRPEWSTAVSVMRARYADTRRSGDEGPRINRVIAVRPASAAERAGCQPGAQRRAASATSSSSPLSVTNKC